MSAVVQVGVAGETLPSLVDRAARALAGARSSAEVLEARDLAGFAYDAAKRAARLAQAKGAHDALIAAAHRAQADALLIESNAKRRLADEYDAAQERGEVASHQNANSHQMREGNLMTLADLGLTAKGVQEARRIRDAEDRDPGIVERTLNDAIARGDEPTRAEVKRVINGREDVMERAAKEEAAMRDQKDFRALRKLWNGSTSNAQRMFRDYIGG